MGVLDLVLGARRGSRGEADELPQGEGPVERARVQADGRVAVGALRAEHQIGPADQLRRELTGGEPGVVALRSARTRRVSGPMPGPGRGVGAGAADTGGGQPGGEEAFGEGER
ncbi:hypothetical protein MA546_17600 [Streptomyces sp. T7(2022)]|uniref:hypothetical protein n=1 Tax=Streptomyces sp. T7(2022) TaxID=2916034 RepID=UPI001EE4CA08|nr:hypothetical protein [Streptomyces sp. T7(2022)]MCG5120564.1 hypothetical protein [Streptomyces sp. T7(2022)]